MRHLIGTAVGIGLSLACGLSNAGSPHSVPHGGGHVSHSVHTGHPSTAVRSAYARSHALTGHSHHGSYLDPHHGMHYSHGHLVVVAAGVGTGTRSLPNSYADALEAWDQHDLAMSQAAINWQIAKSMAIQNQREAAKARDEARRMNAARYRAQQAERLLARRRPADENGLPAIPAMLQLPPNQIDRQTGKICWPRTLQGRAFDAARRGLEGLAAAGHQASRDPVKNGSREIRERIEEIKDQLREQINEMPPMEYIAAQKFLDGLVGAVAIPSHKVRPGDGLAEQP